jgi:hypothetical protein
VKPFKFVEPPGPARSAGLKHALLHDWQGGFPLEPTPFRHVARRLGSTVREVLDQCQLLDTEGFGAGICAHWTEDLRVSRWRLWTSQVCVDTQQLSSSLAAVPGLNVWHEREQILSSADPRPRSALPRLWFDLVAREYQVAEAQIAALRAALPELQWTVIAPSQVPSTDAPACSCGEGAGPCQDLQLARLCEHGLPVVSRPYLAAAAALHRSERDVVLTLKRWQRDGRLTHVSLSPRPTASQSVHTAAAVWGPPLDAATRASLLRFPGVSNLHEWPSPGGPTLVTAAWLPGAAENLLCRALHACGVPSQRYDLWAVRSHYVRDDPLLFADVELPG